MNRTSQMQATTRAVRQLPEWLRATARDIVEWAWFTRAPDGVGTVRRWVPAYNYVIRPRLTAQRKREQQWWDGPLGQAFIELHEIRRAQELADYDRQLRGLSRPGEPEPRSGASANSPAPDRDPDVRDMNWELGQ